MSRIFATAVPRNRLPALTKVAPRARATKTVRRRTVLQKTALRVAQLPQGNLPDLQPVPSPAAPNRSRDRRVGTGARALRVQLVARARAVQLPVVAHPAQRARLVGLKREQAGADPHESTA